LFSPARIEHIISQLARVIDFAIDAGSADVAVEHSTVGSFQLATERCRHIIPDPLANLNWTEWHGAIHEIFRRNATSFPDRTFVVENVPQQDNQCLQTASRQRSFTYGQLFRASEKLAAYLVGNGVEPEDVVVVYAYRGVDLVIAIMGVLLSGATYSVIGMG
jgi:L-aminoadipate-semialdehyde dehydrogenase